MAYDSTSLAVLAYSNGFTLWHYRSVDTPTTISTTGYFNAAAGMLRVGDMILANCGASETASNGIFTVTTNTGTVVDVDTLVSFAP
jgi:hypothetical protein